MPIIERMDRFSITIGSLGITEFAISSISTFVVLSMALTKRTTSLIARHIEAKEDLERIGVARAVNKCGQACADFLKKLEHGTKHSSTTKISLRDRLSVGLWNNESIRTFRTQVHSYRAIVQFAIDSAQLIIFVRSENAHKNTRQETEKQLRILEAAIQEHIKLTRRSLANSGHPRDRKACLWDSFRNTLEIVRPRGSHNREKQIGHSTGTIN
ncbi:hypothetical protein N7504_011647 [Penicillium tannophilum]|nr:hypothetical protein N7504_011647 [Penicillium tannophilum]